MPLLIYGAELGARTASSASGAGEPPALPEEEITIDNFASLIDDQSWEEFMPKGVDKEKFE